MLDELKFRYRNLKPWARGLIMCILGIMPGAWNYLDSAPDLETAREAAQTKETVARQRLAKAKEQIKDLPAMEEKLRVTKEELKKAEKFLPDSVYVDQVLQQVTQSANESDVSIVNFEPGEVKLIPGDYPYNEVRFKISMEGKYGRLGEWLDAVAGNQSHASVKNWSVERGRTKPVKIELGQTAATKPGAEASLNPRGTKEQAEAARENMQLLMKSEIVLYAAATNAQLAELAAAQKAKDSGDKPGAKPADNKSGDKALPPNVAGALGGKT